MILKYQFPGRGATVYLTPQWTVQAPRAADQPGLIISVPARGNTAAQILLAYPNLTALAFERMLRTDDILDVTEQAVNYPNVT